MGITPALFVSIVFEGFDSAGALGPAGLSLVAFKLLLAQVWLQGVETWQMGC